jgi:hypothetical protein
MTGEKKMFTSYVKNKDSQDSIIFGDGNQSKVKGLGKIAISSEHSISNVFLVESLGYNLLSVSQLCNMGYTTAGTVIFGGQTPPKISQLPPKISYFRRQLAYFRRCLAAKKTWPKIRLNFRRPGPGRRK